MMKSSRLRAFTIMELVMAMLISAIVISIVYTAYTIVSKSYLAFSRKNDDMSTLIVLDQRLNRDFAKAEIVLIADSNTVTMKSNTDSVTYRFQNDYITRTRVGVDTFKVATGDFSTAFESSPTESGSTENKIDDLQLVISFEGRKIPYHYHKSYSAVNLFQSPN